MLELILENKLVLIFSFIALMTLISGLLFVLSKASSLDIMGNKISLEKKSKKGKSPQVDMNAVVLKLESTADKIHALYTQYTDYKYCDELLNESMALAKKDLQSFFKQQALKCADDHSEEMADKMSSQFLNFVKTLVHGSYEEFEKNIRSEVTEPISARTWAKEDDPESKKSSRYRAEALARKTIQDLEMNLRADIQDDKSQSLYELKKAYLETLKKSYEIYESVVENILDESHTLGNRTIESLKSLDHSQKMMVQLICQELVSGAAE